MKLFQLFTLFSVSTAQIDNDVNVASLAENLDKIKFELNEILLSRENERDHLEVNGYIDLIGDFKKMFYFRHESLIWRTSCNKCKPSRQVLGFLIDAIFKLLILV